MGMIPVNEGDSECQRCEHFYVAYGCIPTYVDKRPPCGRKVKGDLMADAIELKDTIMDAKEASE